MSGITSCSKKGALLLAYPRIKALRTLASAGAALALLTATPAVASASTSATLSGSTLCNSALVVNVGDQVAIAGGGLAALLARIRVATGLVNVAADVGVVLQTSLCPRH